LVEFLYRIEHRLGKKHGNTDGLSRRQADGCKQCLSIERRDIPPRLDMGKQIGKAGVYSWEEGQLRSEPLPKAVNTFMQTLHYPETSGSCVDSKLCYLGW